MKASDRALAGWLVTPVRTRVEHDDQVRLHSALGDITPADKLAGLEELIFVERDRKLEEARGRRRARIRRLLSRIKLRRYRNCRAARP